MNRLEKLRSQRDAILQLAANYGIRRVHVFGSLARGDATATSDVDLLVDFESDRSLLDLVGFEQDVRDLLGCSVDVVVEGGVSPYLADGIVHDAVPL